MKFSFNGFYGWTKSMSFTQQENMSSRPKAGAVFETLVPENLKCSLGPKLFLVSPFQTRATKPWQPWLSPVSCLHAS